MTHRSILAALAIALLLPLTAPAATIPYTDDFDDDTVGNAAPSESAPESGTFVEQHPNAWSVVNQSGSDNAYKLDIDGTDTGTGRRGSTTIDTGTTFDTNQTFLLETDMKLLDAGAATYTTRIGFGALGSSASFTSGGWYLADLLVGPASSTDLGTLRMIELGGGPSVSSTTKIAVNDNDEYRMTLQGVLSGGNLTLTYTVENVTQNESISVNMTDSTPTAGGVFGYTVGVGNDTLGSFAQAEFDNFSLTIPEPSALVMLLGGCVTMLFTRRRR